MLFKQGLVHSQGEQQPLAEGVGVCGDVIEQTTPSCHRPVQIEQVQPLQL